MADDTDIAVMLLYHWKNDMCDIYFFQEKTDQVWSMKASQDHVKNIKEDLLFLHAWSGCDSTSHFFGKSKATIMKILVKSGKLRSITQVMMDPRSSQEAVGRASALAVKLVYSGQENDDIKEIRLVIPPYIFFLTKTLLTLICYRYNKYMDMACNGVVHPEKLPPTERAAHFHGLRSFHQICEWSLMERHNCSAEEWGWSMKDNTLVPIATDLTIAPPSLDLKNLVRCQCKGPCRTGVCTCRKHGMPCIVSCTGCRGESCSNREEVSIEKDESNSAGMFDNIFDIMSNELPANC